MATFTHADPLPPDCDASTRIIYDYWLSKCRGRRMPPRGDLDPTEIPRALLPGISLVEITAGIRRYTFRLVGTAVVEALKQDPTGKSVREALSGFALSRALQYYDRVVSTRAPVFDPTRLREVKNEYQTDETLFLPLSDDGETVDKILVFARIRPVHDYTPAFFSRLAPSLNGS